MKRILTPNTNFVSFGAQHWAMLLTIVLFSILLPFFAIHFLDQAQQLYLVRAISIILALTVVLWIAIRIKLGEFDKTTDLPLDFCNLSALLMPMLMWHPTLAIHEILFFWILTGTFLASVTPYLQNGFPHFTFLKYWIVHGGLVVLTIYHTAVFDLQPEWMSVLRSFAWLNVYTLVMWIANKLVGSNYFYLLGKPPAPTLLDYFGPWPWYLLVCWGLALIFFTLIYIALSVIKSTF